MGSFCLVGKTKNCGVRNIASKLVDKETVSKYYFTDNGMLNPNVLPCHRRLIVTRDTERHLEAGGGKAVEVVPVWKWLLELG